MLFVLTVGTGIKIPIFKDFTAVPSFFIVEELSLVYSSGFIN